MPAPPATRSDAFTDASPSLIRNLRVRLSWRRQEAFAVVFLDGAGAEIATQVMFLGDETSVHVRIPQIVRAAMERGAHSIIVAHNHPKAGAEPSTADVPFTDRLRAVMTMVGIPLLDHVIVSRKGSYSMAAQGPWEARPALAYLARLLGTSEELHTSASGVSA